MIAKVVLWSNGMLMVFAQDGQQLPQYQGRLVDHLPLVLADAPPTATWDIGDWRNGTVETNRQCFESLAEQFSVVAGRA